MNRFHYAASREPEPSFFRIAFPVTAFSIPKPATGRRENVSLTQLIYNMLKKSPTESFFQKFFIFFFQADLRPPNHRWTGDCGQPSVVRRFGNYHTCMKSQKPRPRLVKVNISSPNHANISIQPANAIVSGIFVCRIFFAAGRAIESASGLMYQQRYQILYRHQS